MKKEKNPFGELNLFRNDQLNHKKLKIGFIGGGPNLSLIHI